MISKSEYGVIVGTLEKLIRNRKSEIEKISVTDEMLEFFSKQKIMMFLEPFIDQKKSEKTYMYVQKIKKVTCTRLTELHLIDEICRKNGINYIVIKGIPLSIILYGNSFCRESHDIDILVPDEEVFHLARLLHEQGYRQETAGVDPNNEVGNLFDENFYQFRSNFYEVMMSKQIEDVKIEIEIKRASSAIQQKDINGFLKHTKRLDFGQYGSVVTNDTIYTFLHLIANVYGNSETFKGLSSIRLRDFFDVASFYYNKKDQLDWDKILRISQELCITHKFYAVFCNINVLWPEMIAQEDVQRFASSNWIYDWTGNERGELVQWDRDLPSRIYDKVEHRRSFIRGTKRKCYSTDNTNYSSPFYLGDFIEIFNYEGTIQYFTCSFNKRNNKICFVIKKKEMDRKKNYKIRIDFLVSDLDMEELEKGFEVQIIGKKKVLFNGKEVGFEESDTILLEFDIQEECSWEIDGKRITCFQIGIAEQLENGYYQGKGKYPDFLNWGVDPWVLVLQ